MANPLDRATDTMSPPNATDLILKYGPALRRYFSRKAGADAADDLVQEVFLRLQARADSAPAANMERFLFTIAKRVLVDRYRRQTARGESFRCDVEEAMDQTDGISPERILAGKQDYARAIVAILGLPPKTRTVFAMHRFGKLSYSAIARKLGISKPAVHDHMRRAVQRIAEKLRDEP